MGLERRENILGYVARGEEFENVERAQKMFENFVFKKKYVRIYVRGCRREDWYSRSDSAPS